jgi:phenylalanyl-tRNA synthetase beta chain
MQFPESWLRSFCNPSLSTQALAHTLTMAGLEVEELRPVAPPFSQVVVGEIVEAAQHPNADRLRVCQVNVGTGSLLNIVCGAPNAVSHLLSSWVSCAAWKARACCVRPKNCS